MRDIRHKILLALCAITIIGEIASIILWTTNRPVGGEPYARFSLAADYTLAVADAAVFAAINIIAFALLFKRNKTGALLLIVASILNRIISYPLFIGGVHGIFITFTAILVIFAYVEYRGLSKFETAFLSLGVVLDLAVSSLLFNAASSAEVGLAFYLVILAVLVGIAATSRKLRYKPTFSRMSSSQP
jgi:hypothetical protein